MKYIIDLNCHICGNKVGEHTLDSNFGWSGNETAEDLGYADLRCSSCEVDHGTFKELMEKAKDVFQTTIEAENFIKENRKKKDFDKKLKTLLEDK